MTELQQAVLDARRVPGILLSLARLIWPVDHDGADCPADMIPSEAQLIEFVRTRNRNKEADQKLSAVFDGKRAEWWVVDTAPIFDDDHLTKPLPHLMLAAAVTNELHHSIEMVHRRWLEIPKNERPTHPLAPIVAAWQTAPVPVDWSRGRQRILPSRLAHVGTQHRRAGRLFTSAAYGSVPDANGSQMVLPFSEEELDGQRGPALPLILYRLGEDRQHGSGAPVPLRLWVEAVRAVPYLDRDKPVRMETTLRQLMADLWPGTHLRPGEYLPKLERAARALDSWEARIPWSDPSTGNGGLRRVVSISDFPRGETFLDDLFSVIVELPPGAKEGPALPDTLNAWGAQSTLAYVGLINLHLRWHDPGVLRVPVGRGKRRTWVQVQEPSRYPDLTNKDLLDIFMPVVETRPVKKRDALARIRRTIASLKAANALRWEGHKLLPPAPGTTVFGPPARGKLSAK